MVWLLSTHWWHSRVSELKMTVVPFLAQPDTESAGLSSVCALLQPVAKPAPIPLDFPVKISKCSLDLSPFRLGSSNGWKYLATFWPAGQGHPAALQVAARLYLPEVLENQERIYHEGRWVVAERVLRVAGTANGIGISVAIRLGSEQQRSTCGYTGPSAALRPQWSSSEVMLYSLPKP